MSDDVTMLVVDVYAQAQLLTVPRERLLATFYEKIGCHTVDAVRLSSDLDMWVDDEGLLVQDPVANGGASYIAAKYGLNHQPYCGTVIFTGGADAEGETLSISPRLAQRLRGQAVLGVLLYAAGRTFER